MTKWTRHAITDRSKIGGLGWRTIVGSPTTVADALARYVDEADVDGFSKLQRTSVYTPIRRKISLVPLSLRLDFSYATAPGTFEDVVDHLVPELQRR